MNSELPQIVKHKPAKFVAWSMNAIHLGNTDVQTQDMIADEDFSAVVRIQKSAQSMNDVEGNKKALVQKNKLHLNQRDAKMLFGRMLKNPIHG